MPLQSILFDHPQCIDDVVSMSPRAKGRSLLQQQLNSFFSAIAICDDEPRTEDPGAAVDATEAVKQNVHGLLSNDSCNGLLPQLRADAFPSRQAIFSQCPVLVDIALWLLDGVVFQLTLNVNQFNTKHETENKANAATSSGAAARKGARCSSNAVRSSPIGSQVAVPSFLTRKPAAGAKARNSSRL